MIKERPPEFMFINVFAILHTTFSEKTSNSADHEQTAPKIVTDQRLHVQKKGEKAWNKVFEILLHLP